MLPPLMIGTLHRLDRDWNPARQCCGGVTAMLVALDEVFSNHVITADRQKALHFDANEFADLNNGALKDVGTDDLVFDVIGGDIQKRSATLVRARETLLAAALHSFGSGQCGYSDLPGGFIVGATVVSRDLTPAPDRLVSTP